MGIAKLNAEGHRWVGEISDFRFNVRFRPGRANIDADTLSRLPLDIEAFESECTEELPTSVVQTVWEGSRVWGTTAIDHLPADSWFGGTGCSPTRGPSDLSSMTVESRWGHANRGNERKPDKNQ